MRAAILLLCLLLCACSDSPSLQAPQDVILEGDAVNSSVALRPAAPDYVGSQACASCHASEYQHWQGSHHDLAMQVASDDSVLGDFDGATFVYFGTESLFYRDEGRFMVRTDGPDGQLQDFEIAYTFGVEPLQQYLIELANGRLQALSIAWDARPAAEGGQRWYHLYPDEEITYRDNLHWTGLNQNWNFMCADCHSTNLQKGYRLSSDTYTTTWSDIDVACEACHGPGSRHVELAGQDALLAGNSGFALSFNELDGVTWPIDPETGNAQRSEPALERTELNLCAQCHSRRSTAHPAVRPQDNLLDHFNVSLLAEGLYHADGQINEEVYVYGSFLQSRMYQAGVTCSNCHEPHSLQLRAEGNALCGQCHLSEKYDTSAHHLHGTDSVGAQCVNCHMPDKTYMGIDARRDHSLRIPRPDISLQLDTPNACNQCHQDKTAEWANSILEAQFGPNERSHYAHAFQAGRQGLPEGEALLSELLLDDSQPAIVRATAASLLPRYFSQQSASVLQLAAQAAEPLIDLGLAGALDVIPPQYRSVFAIPLLYADSRVARGLAAQSLLAAPQDQALPADVRARFEAVIAEYQLSEEFNSDRPESLNNLAGMYSAMGEAALAERYFRQAMAQAPWFAPAYVNLAEHYRRADDEAAGIAVLEQALGQVNDVAVIQHSLGLALVRDGRSQEAMGYLRQAAESPEASARYLYVYAIGLNSTGRSDDALVVLEQAYARYPGDREILSALVSINRELGNQSQAAYYESRLP